MKGFIHICCGDGKGKTTAALGMALRAAGAGMRVYIFQFLKGSASGEIAVIRDIPNIFAERLPRDHGFAKTMTVSDREAVTGYHNAFLEKAWELMHSGEADMIVLDEFFPAYGHGLMDISLGERLVFEKAPACELVLTGRRADEKFIAAADYVSRIECVKHPYQKGTAARKGIEY